MSRYRPLRPVLLVVLLALWLRSIACFTVTKQSSTTSSGRQGASLTAGKNNSTFSLFAEGQFPTDWDNDILRQISRLHTQPFNGIKEYLLAKNMASYVGLKPIDALHMPVPLSLVFLGFDGDGNGGVTIPHTVLQSWFERLDHILPHTRVPMSSISCSEDGHCPGLDGSSRPDVLPSYVHLNFSCHAVKLSAAVVPVFDRALSIFSRPVDPAAAADAEQQVDLGAMEEMVDDLLDSLGLQSSYTVLVLNPSFEAQRPRYGYVDGFSYAEVQLLGNDPQLHSFLAQVPGHSASSTRSSRAGTLPGQQQQQNRYNNLGWWSRPSNKFAVHDLQWLSESWAKRYHSVLDQAEVLRKKLKEQLGAGVKSTAHLQAALVLQYGSASERERLAQMLKSQLQKDAGFAGEEVEDTTQQQALRVMEPVEGCMLDVWVGAGRWVMLDLTAKGNDWGPWVGGQGVKTDATLPRVEDFFLQDSMQQGKEERSKKLAEKDRELTTELELLKVERLAAVQHEHAMAKSWRAHSRAHSAPGTPPPPVDAADSGVSDAVMLQAELDVYEEFALRKCNNVVNPPPVCQKIKWEVLRLMEDLEEMARNPASTHAIHHQRAHGWDIFGALVEDEQESEDDTSAAGRAMALFMAKLGTAISRGIRHVLAPPTATWRTQASHRRPGRKPFHKKVDFLLYIIGDSPSPAGLRSNGPRNKQAINTFDVEGFKKEVAQLALNGQEFKFVERYMTLQDDPALATAFSLSLRSAALEEHHVPSETAPERLFVDSLELGFQLNHHFMAGNTAPHTAAAMKHTKGGGEARVQKGDQARERLEVPVFVFVVERDRPVFIDQHYLSKALPDMVLVMSNRAHRGRHPMGLVCDRNVVSRDPASPLQAALAATVQHLAGILPPHLGYSPGHHAVLHDWLWSVGRNPMALMAKGTHFGQINLDAVHRSFVLDALDSSVESTNEAISMLLAYPTEALAFPAVSKNTGRLRSLLKGFDSLVGAWRQLVSDCEHLDFSLATSELARVEQLTKAFQDQVQDFLDAISSGCSAASHVRAAWQRSQGGLLLSLLIYAGMVAATVAALAVIGTAMYFKRPKKPKVN